jgi:ComF family protein
MLLILQLSAEQSVWYYGMKNSLYHIYDYIKMIAYEVWLFFVPSICAHCKGFLSQRDIFCNNCIQKIFPIVSKIIDITPHFSVTVHSLSDYKDPLRTLVLAKGWSDIVASYHLGSLLWKIAPLKSLDYDYIVPIPLHWTRYATRGFNQAHEMAKAIQSKRHVPLIHALKRIKKTEFQFSLASPLRGLNVKNAFALNVDNKNDYKNKHILLVDDLMTTGSTIREAARILLDMQPRKITVVVACRVL